MKQMMQREEFETLPDLMPTEQAARALGVCRLTAQNMAKRGDVRAVKLGREWRFSKADIERRFYSIA